MHQLLLFDIDGTILKVQRELTHRLVIEVINEVLAREEEFSIPETYRFHGRTDHAIFLDLCEFLGHSRDRVEPLIPTFEHSLMGRWNAYLNSTTVSILPGVVSLLDVLHDDESITLGLLTGNLVGGARAKLEPHNMNRYFRFGAFGSDAVDRNDLPPIALQRANELNGNRFSFDHAVIIGDSNRDIECAKAWGIRSVAVATGGLSADELRAHEPDLLLESLEDREAFLNFVRR
ncbi:MAG: HAD hydrolase-like protein [Ignavibacteriae bacterium]|nr:HAD hydrolase-like protein [Ignavibacteriota bacterium]MCB9216970.1 HAD hydrolase-like protein [Ignavibacteria bacterium]